MPDEVYIPNSRTSLTRAENSYVLSPTRIHEVALQAWLRRFVVTEGYPIPVVFATPMTAFAEYTRLWDGENNPFKYLTELKDNDGNPLYPYPAPVRLPLINIKPLIHRQRPTQSYSIHRVRRQSYWTVDDDVLQSDLGNVAQGMYPSAWDFRWQLAHFCKRPDTQAQFVAALMKAFHIMTGGGSYTWVRVAYPGWFEGHRLCRLLLDGDIEPVQEEDQQDRTYLFRTTVTLSLEGYVPDLDVRTVPALWYLTERYGCVATLDQVDALYPSSVTRTEDLRVLGENRVFTSLTDLPPKHPTIASARLASTLNIQSPSIA